MARTMAERLLPMPKLSNKDQIRFLDNFNYLDLSQCCPWQGSRYVERNYGRFHYKCKAFMAHRVSYLFYYSVDPGRLYVCHECNNTICVNPKHLFLGTNSDNQKHAYDTDRHNQNGDLNPSSKLSEFQVRKILEESNSVGRAELAKKNNVTISTIHQIIRREIWRHL